VPPAFDLFVADARVLSGDRAGEPLRLLITIEEDALRARLRALPRERAA
jgi:hypothetical protein